MNIKANSHLDAGVSRLALLGISSILLSMSFIFTVLSPFPLGLAMVIYGKNKGLILITLTFVLSLFISIFVFKAPFVAASTLFSALVAIACSRTLVSPKAVVKNIAVYGFGIIALVSSFFYISLSTLNIDMKDYLVQQISEQKEQYEKIVVEKGSESSSDTAFDVKALLAQPELAADYIIKEIPGYLMMSIFIIIWINLGLLSRSRRITLYLTGQAESIPSDRLYSIKLPDQLVILVAASLALVVFGDSLSSTYALVGMTSLKVLGVFYFFQGFGIYVAFLDFAKIQGVFRALLVVLTIFTAGQVLAIAGLLDTFFNFRKFLNKKN